MTNPTFFTVVADYKSVVVDLEADVDADPQLGPITAKVTFTPVLNKGDVILATDASPRPTGYVGAPIVARIDTDGRLKLRVEPDGDRDNYANLAAFPATGLAAKVYYDIAEATFYRWNGSAYVETLPYAEVRLLADTALLELDGDLYYKVTFSEVTFNGASGYISPFTFQAPTSDTAVLNLIEVTPVPGQPASGITKIAPGAVRLESGEIIFSFAGVDIPDPLPGLDLVSALGVEDVSFNVKLYGATGLVGTNATTETAAIHAARNAAGVGGKLFFPPGTYPVTGLTASVANQTWELADGATIKMAIGAASALLVTANNVTVDGGVFDASNGTLHDFSQNGIRIQGTNNVTVRNAQVSDSPGHGVYGLNSNKIMVSDCRFIDCYLNGAFVQNSTAGTTNYDIVITGNYVESSEDTAAGVAVLGGVNLATTDMPISRVRITNNTVILPVAAVSETAGIGVGRCTDWSISGNTVAGGWAGLTCPYGTRAVISNNNIRQFKYCGIELPSTQTDCVVSDNSIDATGSAGGSVGIAVSSVSPTIYKRMSIVGNSISGFGSTGTGMGFSGTNCSLESTTITGNSIKGGSQTYKGITFALAVKAVSISGNTFEAATVTSIRGVEFLNRAVSSVSIVGNVFTSTSSSGPDYPIAFSGSTLTGLTVTGNTFNAPSSTGLAVLFSDGSPATNITFTGNSVNGGTSTGATAFQFYNGVSGMAISGNQFSNLSLAILHLLQSTAVTVADVKLSGNGIVNCPTVIRNETSGSVVVAASVFCADDDVQSVTSTATAGSTTTLTGSSSNTQVFTGTTTHTCKLQPGFAGTASGRRFTVINNSTGTVTVNSSNDATISTLTAGQSTDFVALQRNPTTPSHWAVVNAIGTVPVANGGTGSTSLVTAATASSVAARDSNANLSAKGFISGFTTTTSAAGTTTLTISSNVIQEFTGTSTQTVILPTTSIVAGQRYTIINNSTGRVTVQSSAANTILQMEATTEATFTALTATPTTAAHWEPIGGHPLAAASLCGAAWPGGISGEYIIFGGINSLSPSGDVEGRVRFTPYWAPKAFSISRIAINIGTAGSAGSVVRIGAYNDDNGVPGSLIFDAGTVDSTTSGNKEITTTQTLPAGRFWLAAVVQGGAATVARISATTGNNAWNSNAMLATQGGGLDGAVYFALVRYGFTETGALPTPGVTTRANGGYIDNIGHCFRVRLA